MKVRGQISVYNGGSLIFGLSDFPISEFELVAEELLLSDSIIKVQYSDSKYFFCNFSSTLNPFRRP
jgi:hypothetical protein